MRKTKWKKYISKNTGIVYGIFDEKTSAKMPSQNFVKLPLDECFCLIEYS